MVYIYVSTNLAYISGFTFPEKKNSGFQCLLHRARWRTRASHLVNVGIPVGKKSVFSRKRSGRPVVSLGSAHIVNAWAIPDYSPVVYGISPIIYGNMGWGYGL